MNEAIRKTNFMVDEQLCIGCGVCIDACPMKILKVEEGICVIEKDFICLECGTCLRKCPEDAISIEGLSEKESSSFQGAIGKERIEEPLHFTPILKKLTALLINSTLLRALIIREWMLENSMIMRLKGRNVTPDFIKLIK